MDIKQALFELHELKCAAEVTRLDYDAKRAAILAPVAAELADLDAEYAPLTAAAQARAAELEERIKAAVVEAGASVKGDALQAVYSKPRVSWDGKALEGYAAAHPEIVAFRTTGAPSVSIRAVK